MSTYQSKYLKYKNKYLILKKQFAGMRLFPDSPPSSPNKKVPDNLSLPRFSYGTPNNSKSNSDNYMQLRINTDNDDDSETSSFKLPSLRSFDSPVKSSASTLRSFDSPVLPSVRQSKSSPESHNFLPIKIRDLELPSQPSVSRIPQLSPIDNEIISILNSYYGNNWVLTGSVAVKLYLILLNLQELLTFPTRDIDALVLKEDKRKCDITEKKLGNYSRVQKTLERSVTFINNDTSFDVTCVNSMPKYNKIFGINVISPLVLLNYYYDDERDKDAPKIDALQKVITQLQKNNGNNLKI